MNKFLPFIFCIAMYGQSKAQQGSADTYLNNYVSPAPTAGSLGKFVDFPISYYTGTVDITVPIYDLKDGAANIPISLSYHPSGIRVAELASSVGLGWALNAGGMIIRTVRGAPDEGSKKGWNSQYGPTGYFINFGLSKLPMLPYPVNGQIVDNPANLAMVLYTTPGVNAGGYDCEPDLFTFNFNGYSGKFVFDENRTPRLLSDDNLVITPNYNGTTFASWEITTPDGAEYFFGENGTYEVTNPSSTLTGSDPDSWAPSSWYLTRVVYPNTLDTVNLSYTAETYDYHDLGPESALFGNGGQPLQWLCSYLTPGYNLLTTIITGWHLSSITSKNYTINFLSNTARQDLVGSPPMLDSIKISNAAGTCIKKFALGHSYFNSTSATAFRGQIPDNTDMKRLMLTSATEISGDGTISKPPYVFTYNQSIQLPRRLSYDQDSWGFSNNSSGNVNPYFTPGVNYPICAIQMAGSPAYRTSKWPDMSAFSLIAIKDPLGVVTNFTYQANSASNTYPQNQVVGGLRIQQIATTDSVTGITTYRSFTYAGGFLYNNPVYVYNFNNEYYMFNNYGVQLMSYRGYSWSYITSNILKTSQSVVPLQDFNGNHIGYVNVTETFGARGEGGSKQYLYQADIAQQNNSRLDMSNYTATTSISTPYTGMQSGIYGNGHFNDILPQNLQYYQRFDVYNYYPIAPDQVDLRRGKLIGENTFDSLGNLLKSVQNTYQETYHEWMPIRGFKVYRTVGAPYGGGGQLTLDALTYYKLHTGISHLISSVETDYKDGKQMTITHRYGYEDTLHTLRTSDTTVNSTGDSLITKTYYSNDYANSATSDGIFAKMKARHMLVPVATRTWKNNQLIKGTVTQFKDFSTSSADTFINPAKIYAFQTSTPLTAAQAGESVAFTALWTKLLPDSNFFEKADFNFLGTTGRIIEQRLTNDKNQAIIWDNGTHLPLAKVENAYFADVAYCSFETTETGTWTLNSADIVSDAGAPTGTHAYSLAGGLSKSGLTAAQTYVLSYWAKSGASVSISGGTQSGALTGRTVGAGYTYHEVKITGATSISITGSGDLDEVRLYPSTAQMTSYTYDALMRLIGECSANSTISYYDYDAMNRVVDIRDQYGNVIKAYEYNYGQLAR